MAFFVVLLTVKTDYLICLNVLYSDGRVTRHISWYSKKCPLNENRNYLTSKSTLFFDLLDVFIEK